MEQKRPHAGSRHGSIATRHLDRTEDALTPVGVSPRRLLLLVGGATGGAFLAFRREQTLSPKRTAFLVADEATTECSRLGPLKTPVLCELLESGDE